MKVGILTWYNVSNYGSFFQAYALQEVLKSLHFTVEVLRHDRQFSNDQKASIDLSNILNWIREQTPNRRKNRRFAREKNDKFITFQNKYLNIGDFYSETSASKVVIGSDQIFDINQFYYPYQFGEGINCKDICAYAPSFGETTADDLKRAEKYTEIVNNIRNLSFVSARDYNTQNILSSVRGEEIPMVLDPVLLYSFEEEKKKWNQKLISDRYCIVYTWGGYTTSQEFAKQCALFARKNGLKLVSIGEIRYWCDIQFASASPAEFFELFMYADVVLTNMFHGTCFSILFEKPFYSFIMPHNENKLGALLMWLGLENQILHTPEQLSQELPKIDYGNILCDLERKRDISYQYLRESLGC